MAATVTREAPSEPAPEFDGAAEATRSTEELFQWSAHVHVGQGATDCEHGEDGHCDDQRHFHCWLCLPNTFQARDISDKAFAAKARKRRALLADGSNGTEASDSFYVLDEQISAWALTDVSFDALCQQIADRRMIAEGEEIRRALSEDDRFEHYGADLEEFRRLGSLPGSERDSEEWERLSKDLEEWRVEFERRADAVRERERHILAAMPRSEVLEIERQYQIDQITTEQFLHVYYTWAYYTCARVPCQDGFPVQRAFKTPEALKNTAPEILAALRNTYRSLENHTPLTRGDAAGN